MHFHSNLSLMQSIDAQNKGRFEDPKIKKLFKKNFRENADIYNLDLWNEIENSNHNIFSGMYQFWCQKV